MAALTVRPASLTSSTTPLAATDSPCSNSRIRVRSLTSSISSGWPSRTPAVFVRRLPACNGSWFFTVRSKPTSPPRSPPVVFPARRPWKLFRFIEWSGASEANWAFRGNRPVPFPALAGRSAADEVSRIGTTSLSDNVRKLKSNRHRARIGRPNVTAASFRRRIGLIPGRERVPDLDVGRCGGHGARSKLPEAAGGGAGWSVCLRRSRVRNSPRMRSVPQSRFSRDMVTMS